MKKLMFVAVLGLGATAACAGPSENQFRPPGSGAGDATVRTVTRDRSEARMATYRLTGDRPQRRVEVVKDVPQGRGQTLRVPFWVWVSE
jgi:hypothetical protein